MFQKRLLHSCKSLLRNYSFKEIYEISKNYKPNGKTFIVDVREPEEIKSTGIIPHAISLPISHLPDPKSFTHNDNITIFKNSNNLKKVPSKDDKLIFYCKAGVRAAHVDNIAKALGYKDSNVYPGSWLDWVKNEGPTVTPNK